MRNAYEWGFFWGFLTGSFWVAGLWYFWVQ